MGRFLFFNLKFFLVSSSLLLFVSCFSGADNPSKNVAIERGGDAEIAIAKIDTFGRKNIVGEFFRYAGPHGAVGLVTINEVKSIYKFPLDGSEPVNLLPDVNPRFSPNKLFLLSNDYRFAVFCGVLDQSGNGEYYILNVITGDRVRLSDNSRIRTCPFNSSDTFVKFSPDNSKVALIFDDVGGSDQDLLVFSVDGSGRKTVYTDWPTSSYSESLIGFSRDNEYLFYRLRSSGSGVPPLRAYHYATDNTYTLANAGADNVLRSTRTLLKTPFAPGKVLFTANDQTSIEDLYISDNDGSNKIQLNDNSIERSVEIIEVSSSTPHEIFYSDHNALFSVDPDGSNRNIIKTYATDFKVYSLVVSSINSSVVFLEQKLISGGRSNRVLYSAREDGSLAPVPLFTSTEGVNEVSAFCASDSSSEIFYFVEVYDSPSQNRLYRVNYDGSGTTTLAIDYSKGPITDIFCELEYNTVLYVQNSTLNSYDLINNKETLASPIPTSGAGFSQEQKNLLGGDFISTYQISASDNVFTYKFQGDVSLGEDLISFDLDKKQYVKHLPIHDLVNIPDVYSVNNGKEFVFKSFNNTDNSVGYQLGDVKGSELIKITPEASTDISHTKFNKARTWFIYSATFSDESKNGIYLYSIKDRLGPYKVSANNMSSSAPFGGLLGFLEATNEIYYSYDDRGVTYSGHQIYTAPIGDFMATNKTQRNESFVGFQPSPLNPTQVIASFNINFTDFTYYFNLFSYSTEHGFTVLDPSDFHSAYYSTKSINGDRILYGGQVQKSPDNFELRLADKDGSNKSTLLSNSDHYYAPIFLDNDQVNGFAYFSSAIQSATDDRELFRIKQDGTGLTKLSVASAGWSISDAHRYEEGSDIVYEIQTGTSPNLIEKLIHIDSESNQNPITPTSSSFGNNKYFAYFSRTKILFRGDFDTKSVDELYIYDTDSKATTKVNLSVGNEDIIKSHDFINDTEILARVLRKTQGGFLSRLYRCNLDLNTCERYYTDIKGTDSISIQDTMKDGEYSFFIGTSWDDDRKLDLYYKPNAVEASSD
ncbi:MAG: TolB family protein [Bdellovibrionales bacterium]